MEKILPISFKLNFTPNTLSGYGLIHRLPFPVRERGKSVKKRGGSKSGLFDVKSFVHEL